MREGLGFIVGLLVRIWLFTLRARVLVDPAVGALAEGADAGAAAPWVLAFFHGTQFPLLAWRRRRRTAVLVSLSRDGALQAGVLRALGFWVVRGSTRLGGARGAAALVRRARAGDDLAFAVDGPRGPRGHVKPGAAWAARHARGVLVPMGSAVTRGHMFERAWDRYAVAWPFSRVAIALGPPLPRDTTDAQLGAAIEAANRAAARSLAVQLAPGGEAVE
ncbi:MAG TPA: DUF374 domain-containing protein [Polyangiaceae bacterium]|nr:DUF374 domain-containing protein [Polyangiaceae bacterium]